MNKWINRTPLRNVVITGKVEAQQLPNTLSDSEKLYGLSRFWQEVNYNFVYFEKVDHERWDSAYLALLESITETPNDYEYYRELQRFCALLNDGHTNIMLPPGITEWRTMFGEYRLIFENIEGKAIVTHVNLSKKDDLPVGSELIEVNGMPVRDYIDQYVKPYISTNADYIREDLSIQRVLLGVEGQSYDVVFRKPDQSTITMQLTHAFTEEAEFYPPFNTSEMLEYKTIEDKIGYLSLNTFENSQIVDLFMDKLPEIQDVAGLIIDLRKNGGGSTNYALDILQYFTSDTLYGAKVSTRLHLPYYKAVGSFITDPSDTIGNARAKKSLEIFLGIHMEPLGLNGYLVEVPMSERIIIPTVFLIGHATASAAEDMLIYADGQDHMVKIGQRTYASTGQPFLFDLPGGGRARICTKKDTYADGRAFVGVGVKPDIEITPTLDDWIKRRDAALETAIEYLEKHIK